MNETFINVSFYFIFLGGFEILLDMDFSTDLILAIEALEPYAKPG